MTLLKLWLKLIVMFIKKRGWFFLFLFSFSLRITLLAVLYATPALFDPSYVTDHWDNIARNMLDGRGFSWVEDGSIPTITRSPMYAVFLAGLIAVTDGNLLVMRIIYLALDSIIGLLVPRLSYRILGSKSAAIYSGLFYAVFLFPAWHASKLSPDTFFSFVLLLTVMLFFRFVESAYSRTASLPLAIASGLSFGVGILTKKTILFLPLIFVLLTVFRKGLKKRIILPGVAWLFAILVAIFPWLYRNYRVAGGLAPTQTLTWFNFWYGEFVDENISRLDENDFQARAVEYIEALGEGASYFPYVLTPEEDLRNEADLRRMALGHIKNNFGHFLAKTGRNLARFWYLTETGRMTRYTKLAGAIAFVFFIAGAALLANRRRFGLEALALLMTVFYFNIIYAPIFSIVRYMTPVVPYIAVFAGFFVASLLARVHLGGGRSLIGR